MKTYAKNGDIIFVDRGLYKHYGVYNHARSVIHFSPENGAEINPDNAYIRETSLSEFLKDGGLQIDTSVKKAFSPKEIVRRALCMVGTNLKEYDLIFFNCEHFAHWCATDQLESKQVKKGVVIAGTIAATAAAALFLKKILDKDKSG